MTHVSFVRKGAIEPMLYLLKVISAEIPETHRSHIRVEVMVVDGKHEGHTFEDVLDFEPETNRIHEGTRAWDLFSACLGPDFDNREIQVEELIGKEFVARVARISVAQRNRLKPRTIEASLDRGHREATQTSPQIW